MNLEQIIQICLSKTQIEFRYYPDQEDWYRGWIHAVNMNEYGSFVITIREENTPDWKTPDLIFNQMQIKTRIRVRT